MPSRDARDGPELVIRDALQHWKECRAHQDTDVEKLRRLWQAGIEKRPRSLQIDRCDQERGPAPSRQIRTVSKRRNDTAALSLTLSFALAVACTAEAARQEARRGEALSGTRRR